MARFMPSIALLIATTLPALAAPAWAEESSGTVIWVRGQVKGAIAPSATWTELAPDTQVKAGDTLKTGDDSAAEVVLGSGARVQLGANTILRLVDLEGPAPRVMVGRVHLFAAPQGETHLAAGTFHMTGTNAEAVVERSNGKWHVAVLAGTFRVVDAARSPMDVDAGKVVDFGSEGVETATLTRTQLEDFQQGFQQGLNEPKARPSEPPKPSPAPSAVAQTAPVQAPVPRVGPNATGAALLSALLPGVGQIYAGDVPKGLLYLGLDSALVGTLFWSKYYAQPQIFLGSAIGLGALNLISPVDAMLSVPSEQ